jgi:NAD(P)-dependent dehydrogenase (short-subunit alcohol dehydrogenase family)
MNPWHSLAGKNIWITGGAGYLGSAVTRAADAAGATVLCLDLPGRAQALVEEHGLGRTRALDVDLTDAAAIPALVETTIAAHGVPDGVAHLAIPPASGLPLSALTVEGFRRVLDLALPPTFALCRAVAERMKPRRAGSVVLFSSMYGVVAPDYDLYHAPMAPNPIEYGTCKAGVLQLARYFATHYGPDNLRFNCVTPGPFPKTAVQQADPSFLPRLAQKTVLRRIGHNSEIVGPTLFLLGDGASFVTGHSLVVDGGWTIR